MGLKPDCIAVLSGGFAREELASCKLVAIYQSVLELERDYEKSLLARQPVVFA